MSCFARGPVRTLGGVLSPLDLCYGEDYGGSSNGRTSGFGPENRGSNPCPPAMGARRGPPIAEALARFSRSARPGRAARARTHRGGNSISFVASPTVVILAAGQGTRMRSSTPKMLHGVCGLPMVLWPVRAALEAGAGRIVVVDSPAEALREVLPEGVELAVQTEPSGTAGAVL